MQVYEREATPLGTAAARHALEQYAQQHGQDVEQVAATVTHLLAVSCTGLFAPGLDFALAKELQLPPTVRRTLIGFMGCAAAFNGLRLAAEIVRGQPEARVLVVSVELCSLHSQPSDNYDLLVGASIFSDGARPAWWVVLRPATAITFVWRIFTPPSSPIHSRRWRGTFVTMALPCASRHACLSTWA